MRRLVMKRITLAGLAGGIAMATVEMVLEAIAGDGLWAFPVLVAATVMPWLKDVESPVAFSLVPVALGFVGHLLASLSFTALLARLRGSRGGGPVALAVYGAVNGLALSFLARVVVVPAVDPALLRLDPLAFTLAHVAWGSVAGLVLGWGAEEGEVCYLSPSVETRMGDDAPGVGRTPY